MVVRCKHDTQKLQFHRYDVCDKAGDDMRRRVDRMNLLATSNFVRQVRTYKVEDSELIKQWHDKFVSDGYEGIILRDPKATYKFKYRGPRLLKYKEFNDKEFTITGYWYDQRQYDGALHRCIKFKCYSDTGITFDVVPKGSLKQRNRWFKEGWKFIGKELTVRYQELSEDGVPIFPIGVGIRDFE